MARKKLNKETQEQVTPIVEEVKVEETKTETEELKTETEEEAKPNKEKVNTTISIEEVTKLYEECGIKCYNPTGKGNYRIIGGAKGSSLNLKPKKGEYIIYSTDEDYDLVKSAELKFEDLILELGTNSRDKVRPNTIICKTVDTLKALLAVYAKNPMNQVVKAEA